MDFNAIWYGRVLLSRQFLANPKLPTQTHTCFCAHLYHNSLNVNWSVKYWKQAMWREMKRILCPLHFSVNLILFEIISQKGASVPNCYVFVSELVLLPFIVFPHILDTHVVAVIIDVMYQFPFLWDKVKQHSHIFFTSNATLRAAVKSMDFQQNSFQNLSSAHNINNSDLWSSFCCTLVEKLPYHVQMEGDRFIFQWEMRFFDKTEHVIPFWELWA
jgi:hypothetical protein